MRGLPDAVKKVKFTNEELPWQLFFWAFQEPILMLLQPSDSDDSNLNDIVNFNIMWREFSKMQWGRLSLWDMNYLDSAIFFVLPKTYPRAAYTTWLWGYQHWINNFSFFQLQWGWLGLPDKNYADRSGKLLPAIKNLTSCYWYQMTTHSHSLQVQYQYVTWIIGHTARRDAFKT